MSAVLTYIADRYPRVLNAVHWANPLATFLNFEFNPDVALKVLGFLLVTVPLGVVQWWNLVDRWKKRRAGKADESKPTDS